MSAVSYSVADLQAMAVCWLSRQDGLPNVHELRAGVAQLHGEGCGWCAYPLDELQRMRKAGNAALGIAPGRISRDEERWWGLVSHVRLQLLRDALGQEEAGT